MGTMTTIVGGWSNFNFDLDANSVEVNNALKAFHEATDGLVGAGYKPLAFATQIVAGLNYCFLSEGKLLDADATEIAALVYVYAPLNGTAQLTRIEQIHPY